MFLILWETAPVPIYN